MMNLMDFMECLNFDIAQASLLRYSNLVWIRTDVFDPDLVSVR
jgi:hypothetical protein